MNRRQPLDLRLLPAALAAWAAALAAVRVSWETSRALALSLLLCAVAAAVIAVLLFLRGSQQQARQGAAQPDLSERPGVAVAVQAVMCLIIAAGVFASAASSVHQLAASGWTHTTQSPVPVEVTLRMGEDPQQTLRRAPGGAEQVRARVTVLAISGEEVSPQIGAEAVLLADAEQAEHMQSGHRYRLKVTATALEQAERATALLFPFGETTVVQLGADTRTEVAEVFSQLRRATVEHSENVWGDGSALLPGVVLGDRSGQEQDLTEAMQISGLTHMTVVSGTHCSLMLGAVLGVHRLLRLPRALVPVLVIMALLLFVMLVEPAPSVIRAAIMGSIGALAVFAGRGRASSALLCLCVLILLLFDPWYSVDPAFQLSVAATIGIVLTGQRLREVFSKTMPGWVAAPLALAASAQLFITVVLLPLSEGITVYSVPVNIIAGPLLPLAVVPGLVGAVVSVALPGLSQAILWGAGLPAAGIGALGRATAALPGALAPWPEGIMGWALIGLYLAAAVLVSLLLINARCPRLWEAAVLMVAVAAMLALILAPLLKPSAGLPDTWRMALCDVGQGDMVVIRTAEDAAIVWDTGEYAPEAAQCLDQLGVNTVEVLMISHEHADHYGGAAGVLGTSEVKWVLHGGSEGWIPSEEDAFEELADIDVLRAEVGDAVRHQEEYPVSWEVLVADTHHRNPNDNSMAVRFEFSGSEIAAGSTVSLLTLGDLEEQVTAGKVRAGDLGQPVDVLQVPHHGAANGSTELMQESSPAAALIGVGVDNSYGHPAGETLETLDELDATVFRTDEHGTVAFTMTESGLEAHSLDP